MGKKEVTSLEAYYQTESEWHNEHIVKLIAEVKQQDNFKDVRQAIELYNFGMDCFYNSPAAPLKAIEVLDREFKKAGLEDAQAVFILEKLTGYIDNSGFDDEDITDKAKETFVTIFEAELQRRKAQVIELTPQKPLVKNIRATLKTWVQNELEKLPETLEELPADKRVSVLCKLIPFVLPRVDSVHSERNEEDENEVWKAW